MKAFLKFCIIALVFASMPASAQTSQTATIKTNINCDHCAACETCGEKFNKSLLKQKGVQMVALDEKSMTIKVTFNSKKISLQQIKTAISKLGYDADEIKADKDAYEGLDSCCKKV